MNTPQITLEKTPDGRTKQRDARRALFTQHLVNDRFPEADVTYVCVKKRLSNTQRQKNEHFIHSKTGTPTLLTPMHAVNSHNPKNVERDTHAAFTPTSYIHHVRWTRTVALFGVHQKTTRRTQALGPQGEATQTVHNTTTTTTIQLQPTESWRWEHQTERWEHQTARSPAENLGSGASVHNVHTKHQRTSPVQMPLKRDWLPGQSSRTRGLIP